MRSVLRHVAFKPTINVVGIVARNAARLLLIGQILSRHQRLWTFNRFVFGAVLRRIFRALFMIRISAVHAAHAVSHRPPKQITAMYAICGCGVRVFFEAMRMRETFLMTS